jgi:2-iminobutanoate/2-iminopropanoate deaminase
MPRKSYTASGAVSVGPYSHGIESEGFVYLSGQTPMDPKTGKIVDGDIIAQTEQSFFNLFEVLKSAGLTSDDVILNCVQDDIIYPIETEESLQFPRFVFDHA